MTTTVRADDFKIAMRHLSAAVSIVTTAAGSEVCGITVSSVASLTVDPARLLVCVNVAGRAYRLLSQSRIMAVNVLAGKHEHLARAFAGMNTDQCKHFVDGEWSTMVTGAPVLDGAVAVFDCKISDMFVTHSHAVIFGDVVAAMAQPLDDCLLYRDGRFRVLPADQDHRSLNCAATTSL